jgi:hypothetical protein
MVVVGNEHSTAKLARCMNGCGLSAEVPWHGLGREIKFAYWERRSGWVGALRYFLPLFLKPGMHR